MSAPVHVGECRTMLFGMAPHGSAPYVYKPWQRFLVADEALVIAADWLKAGDDRGEFEIRCQNGWAVYRQVGFDHIKRYAVLELVRCDDEAPV